MIRPFRTVWLFVALVGLAACARVEAPAAGPALVGPNPALHELRGVAGERLWADFDVMNDGGVPLSLTATSDADWLQVVEGGSVVVHGGRRGFVGVEATCAGETTRSVRYGTVTIDSDRGDRLHGTVRLTCEAAPAPEPEPVPEPEPEPEPTVESFDITLVFYGSQRPSASQRAAFERAAARWSEAVVRDLPDRFVDVRAGECFGAEHPAYAQTLDDLLIFASVVPIDGPGSILAQAGPCRIRADSGLPYVGLMEFDVDDVAHLEAQGLFEATVLHEMGHVLGIGTVWEYGTRDMIDPIGTRCSGSTQTARFNGPEATRQHERAAWSGMPHVETDHGPGTACGHWDEERYGDELMTGIIGRSMPLSAITVGSLADIGYGVDVGAADPYGITSGLALQSEPLDLRAREVLLEPTAAPD